MLQNPRAARVRAVSRLSKRGVRQETGRFLIEGPQAVREALACRPELVVELFVTPAAWEKHPELRASAERAGVMVELASEQVLAALADTVTPQGIIGVADQAPVSIDEIFAGSPRLVAICEQIRDPGNLGTIIRAADATGADAVILTGGSVDPYNPKVVRSTTGSLFHLPIAVVPELGPVLEAARAARLQLVAADVKGEDLLAQRQLLREPTAWLFGNEARGLDDEALALVDRVLRLPIFGRAESLNLATAASVCLYESAFSQRS